MKGRVLFAVSSLLAGMMAANPADALMIRYDLEQLSVGAERIVVGDVVDMESRFVGPGRTIYTFVTIGVDEAVKGGGTGDEVVLRVPGGSIEEEEMTVTHAPEFMIGERVLVFTATQIDGQEIVYNAENGKYTIESGRVVEKDRPLENFVMVIRAYLDGAAGPNAARE